MRLDLPTLFVGSLAFELLLGVALLLYGRHRRVYPGFWHYAGSIFVVCACYVGLMTRHLTPLPLSVAIVAGTTFLGALLRLDALSRFAGRAGVSRTTYLCPLAVALVFGWLALVGCPQEIRAALQSLLFSGLVLLGIEAVLDISTVDRPLRLVTAALLVAQALAMVGRAVAWRFLPFVGLTDPSPVHGMLYSLSMVSEMGFAAIYVLMNSTRLERDLAGSTRELAGAAERLRESLARLKTLEGFLSICVHCKKIRATQETWEAAEVYMSRRSGLEFSPQTCATCLPACSGEETDRLIPASESLSDQEIRQSIENLAGQSCPSAGTATQKETP